MGSLTVHIPQPCHERWDDMQPAEQGRFCGNCQKTVIDYTAFSDQELVRLLSQIPEASCGRFHNDQLNRPLAQARPDVISVWHRWVGVLTMTLFGWQTAQAQSEQTAVAAVHVAPERPDFQVDKIPARPEHGPDAKWTLSGRVMSTDSNGHLLPLSMANVIILGLNNSTPGELCYTQTDSTGSFTLLVPAQPLVTQLTASVNATDNRRGRVSFEVTPNTQSIRLNDIVLYQVLTRRAITGGGICTIKPPTLWQKVKRKLFR